MFHNAALRQMSHLLLEVVGSYLLLGTDNKITDAENNFGEKKKANSLHSINTD